MNAKPASSTLRDELAGARCVPTAPWLFEHGGACGAGATWRRGSASTSPLHRAAYVNSTPTPAPASAEPATIAHSEMNRQLLLPAGELGQVPDCRKTQTQRPEQTEELVTAVCK
ncbi:hypothetical protein PR003_g17964 [Phytophthora rubi]|uniref:Uncharacterized protein n=1 Tax=Phytophthora rubi TaxID=129364 RepID=A0A6A3KKZ5_9STRA|nr:hypothetical protein PR002_g17076 [Phytophthora rubi]KAE9009047.1 hypothetical protein PR001_g16542 [Phytophthora rubi]KAE9319440.1 hypothetical protein PR003_g17964 [Phytophthora rubi]